MLHTKFRGNRPAGSGEEDFYVFLTYMGMAVILVMGQHHVSDFHFLVPESFHKNWFRLAN